jgi:hypothetical protein
VAHHRGAIDPYILPNLGRAMVHEVDQATLDTLYARVRPRAASAATAGSASVGASRRYGPAYATHPAGADETVHEPDCARGWPVSASAVPRVHSVGRLQASRGVAGPPTTGQAGDPTGRGPS